MAGLNQPEQCLRDCLVENIAYFTILEPKYFSEELASEWVWLRSKIGYPEPGLPLEHGSLKESIKHKVLQLSDSDLALILFEFNNLFARLTEEIEAYPPSD